MEQGAWKLLKTSRGGVKLLHLFFVDDLLLFVEVGHDQIKCIKDGLRSFCNASGQRKKFSKSLILFSPNTSEQVATSLSISIGIPRTLELGHYLGHHILHQGRNWVTHNNLLQKVRAQLDRWKTKVLSRAGRLTLAKSVVSTMVNFLMQFQKLPTRIHKELDRQVRRCVLGTQMIKSTSIC